MKAMTNTTGLKGNGCYKLANLVLWVVVVMVGGVLNILPMCDGACDGAGFLLIGVHLVAVAGSFIGILFSLIALVRSNERKRLRPLLIPATIVCAYWAFVVPQFGSSDPFDLAPVRVVGAMTILGIIIVASQAMSGSTN